METSGCAPQRAPTQRAGTDSAHPARPARGLAKPRAPATMEAASAERNARMSCALRVSILEVLRGPGVRGIIQVESTIFFKYPLSHGPCRCSPHIARPRRRPGIMMPGYPNMGAPITYAAVEVGPPPRLAAARLQQGCRSVTRVCLVAGQGGDKGDEVSERRHERAAIGWAPTSEHRRPCFAKCPPVSTFRGHPGGRRAAATSSNSRRRSSENWFACSKQRRSRPIRSWAGTNWTQGLLAP
jgi:hypothetical protein